MPDGENGNTIFSGTVNAKNLQTGENASIHEGDNVSGDKVQGQQIAGDMSVQGSVNQTIGDGSQILTPVQFVEKLQQAFEAATRDADAFSYAASATADSLGGIDGEDSFLDDDGLPPISLDDQPQDIQPLGADETDAVFAELKTASAVTPEEMADPEKISIVVSAVDGFKSFAKRCAPKVGEAMLAGAAAAVRASIQTNPVVAGVLATLDVFRTA